MLTGDKLQTAENIAKSCRLINPDMKINRLATDELSVIKEFLTTLEKSLFGNNKKKDYLIE